MLVLTLDRGQSITVVNRLVITVISVDTASRSVKLDITRGSDVETVTWCLNEMTELDEITVVVQRIRSTGRIVLGFDAPRHVSIVRTERLERGARSV